MSVELTIIGCTTAQLLLLIFHYRKCHFNDMKTLSLWIFAVLIIIPTGAKELKSFPENYVVVKMNEAATLSCDTKLNRPVTWKFNNKPLNHERFDSSVDPGSQSLTVKNVHMPLAGEYSCWAGDVLLSSTYLLLEHDESWEADFLICRAKSYDCNFTCKWTRTGDTAVRIGLGHDCGKGKKSCVWVSKPDKLEDGVFQFEISHNLPPYAEESTMLEVTAEAIVNLSVLRGTKRFYLRDIVQPDSPKIVRCQEEEQDLKVTIAPPSTWSTPHSFFRLEHEIEYMLRDDGTTRTANTGLIPKSISKLRVRSRDSLVLSPWSHWTSWNNVTL